LIQQALKQEKLSFQLMVQRDGEEMFRYIDRVDVGELPCPDIVLLDLNLPKKNGEAVLARIQRSPAFSAVPVVIVTSSDSPRDRQTTLDLGARTYFRKPNDFDEFMRL